MRFKDSTFTSYYRAKCGNDHFITSYGKYSYTDSLEINFYLEKITKKGMGEDITIFKNQFIGTYENKIVQDSVVFRKKD